MSRLEVADIFRAHGPAWRPQEHGRSAALGGHALRCSAAQRWLQARSADLLPVDTLRTIAADPKHLGARIGTTLVLHTWGSALTHHPHVHGIVPGAAPTDGVGPLRQTPVRRT